MPLTEKRSGRNDARCRGDVLPYCAGFAFGRGNSGRLGSGRFAPALAAGFHNPVTPPALQLGTDFLQRPATNGANPVRITDTVFRLEIVDLLSIVRRHLVREKQG